MHRVNKLTVERDLVIIDLLTLILVLIVSLSSPTWLRIVFGLPFILFFPGYMLIAALFPRKEGLDNIERLALSIGLSIAIVPLIGLILNYAWSIKLTSILVSVSLFILVMSAIAWYKRWSYPPEDRFSVPFLYRQHLPSLKLGKLKGLDRVLSIVLVISILGALGTLGFVIASPKEGERFTEFYILGEGGKAEDYPEELAVGEIGKVILGITNHEHETTNYRVEVWIYKDGVEEQLNIWLYTEESEEGEELKEIETGPLNHGEKWGYKIGEEEREYMVGFAALEPSNSTMLLSELEPFNSTTLTKAVPQGQTVLAVAGMDNFEVGDYIQIGSSDEGTDELVQIEVIEEDIDVNESEITLSTALTYEHNEGEPVTRRTILEVDKTDNFEVGDYLQIGTPYKGNVEFVQIQGININPPEITTTTGLQYYHNGGETVIERQKVEFRLYKAGESEPLTMHLWVNVTPV